MEYNKRIFSKRDAKKQRKFSIIIICIFIFLLLSVSGGYLLFHIYWPNSEMASPYEMIEGLREGEVNLMFNSEIIPDHQVLERDGILFLPKGFVLEYLDPHIFWDARVNMLTITTPDTVIRIYGDNLEYELNGQIMPLATPVLNIQDAAYLPVNLLTELYDVELSFLEEYTILLADSTQIPRTQSNILQDTPMRFAPSIRSPIAEHLVSGEEIMLLLEESENENFRKVRTLRGLIGYVDSRYIGEENIIPPVIRQVVDTKPNHNIDGPIVLLWEQVFSRSAAADPARRVLVPQVNVMSPTWFSFDAETLNGDIVSIASREYVDWAHANGKQIWALISDNFDVTVSRAVLDCSEVRRHVINQLMEFVEVYNLDGINIDYEAIVPNTARYFIQFLRELRPPMHAAGAILSMDAFVPTYTRFWNRTEIAKAVDYVVIMAYDEHWSGSPVSGPVASLPFVRRGIVETMYEVPHDMIILGLPFYVRIWRETQDDEGNISRTIRNFSMDRAYRMFRDAGAAFEWQDDIGSYYAEFYTVEYGEEIKYRVWLECPRSIEQKMFLFQEFELAGIAAWARNLETEEVWNVIGQFL